MPMHFPLTMWVWFSQNSSHLPMLSRKSNHQNHLNHNSAQQTVFYDQSHMSLNAIFSMQRLARIDGRSRAFLKKIRSFGLQLAD